jgi:hypothetical protein
MVWNPEIREEWAELQIDIRFHVLTQPWELVLSFARVGWKLRKGNGLYFSE